VKNILIVVTAVVAISSVFSLNAVRYYNLHDDDRKRKLYAILTVFIMIVGLGSIAIIKNIQT
jgi:hypothetical protein